MTKQRRHNWEPGEGDKVKCSRCGVEANKDEARRGVGACQGKRGRPQLATPNRVPSHPPIKELGNCGACDKPLKQVPFNSGLDMIACVNKRCDLYRERLRFVQPMTTKERLAQVKA